MKIRTEAVQIKSSNPDQVVFLTAGGAVGRRLQFASYTLFMTGLIGTSISYAAFLSNPRDSLGSLCPLGGFAISSVMGLATMIAAKRITVDKSRRQLTQSLDIGFQLQPKVYPLERYKTLTISSVTTGAGRRKRTTYPVNLIGDTETLELDAPGHLLSAQHLANGIALFSGLPIQDNTTPILPRDIRADYLADNSFFFSGYVCFLRQLHLSTMMVITVLAAAMLWALVYMIKCDFVFVPFFVHVAILLLLFISNICEYGLTAK